MYDGLYVTHKPEDHNDWQKRKDVNKSKNRKKPSEDSKNYESEEPPKKLTLTDTLKTALMTKCAINGAQEDFLIREAETEADF